MIGQKIGQNELTRVRMNSGASYLRLVTDRPTHARSIGRMTFRLFFGWARHGAEGKFIQLADATVVFQLRNTSPGLTESSSVGCSRRPLTAVECGQKISSLQGVTV